MKTYIRFLILTKVGFDGMFNDKETLFYIQSLFGIKSNIKVLSRKLVGSSQNKIIECMI